ncbi:MAG TPA: hypothetical protein VKB09_16160 [Thermomicrobiales bacterium]|nr:hypothetical protein [Thermomicrobiales bacterium]
MSPINEASVASVVLGLDRWFDAMRVTWPTPGYGGPVVHWWNHSLVYRGAGLDWRYEGIVDGYLVLWRRTGDRRWLVKATRAGDDLVEGQLANGCFRNSMFELNPGDGGTPHEAAADVALLLLAQATRTDNDTGSDCFLAAALHNLKSFFMERLWHKESGMLWDSPSVESFVPNKAATFIEAVLHLAAQLPDPDLVARYALPTGQHILTMQVRRPGDILDGAIAQNRFGKRVVESYFPLYVARCVPALLGLWEWTGEERFRDGAVAAARFVARVRDADGGLPQVLYARGRWNRHPRWIAGSGDVVRALTLASRHAEELDPASTVGWIVNGARPDGRVAAASGFGRVLPWGSRRDRVADEIGVVGWCDKAFRALAPIADPRLLDADVAVEPPAAIGVAGVLR